MDPELSLPDFKNLVGSLKPKLAFCDLRIYAQLEAMCKGNELSSCKLVAFGEQAGRTMFDSFMRIKPDADFMAAEILDPKTKVAFIISTQGIFRTHNLFFKVII